jgi:hypothetical protein
MSSPFYASITVQNMLPRTSSHAKLGKVAIREGSTLAATRVLNVSLKSENAKKGGFAVMMLMRANTFQKSLKGWALKIETFLGPEMATRETFVTCGDILPNMCTVKCQCIVHCKWNI